MKFLCAGAVGLACIVPVPGAVLRSFKAPACERCAGHRGVTLQTKAGHTVVATASGEVEFAGQVGNTLYVVQRVSPSVRVTYGGLAGLPAEMQGGHELVPGDPVGQAADTTYISVRVGETHVEPLRALGLGRPRLVGPGGVGTAIVGPEPLSR
jgi:septal ring factor EnvC (AmiA/AmiB activator)